jgi:hypothetical protein
MASVWLAGHLSGRVGGGHAPPSGGSSPRPGQASAFKMGYAGFPKGTTVLLLELTLMAQAWGFLDALLAKYARSHPEAFQMLVVCL